MGARTDATTSHETPTADDPYMRAQSSLASRRFGRYARSDRLVRVVLFDASREFAVDASALEDAAVGVLRSGSYILGPEVAAFEDEVASWLGARHAIGCASGTDSDRKSVV